jgi:hypothetical protein
MHAFLTNLVRPDKGQSFDVSFAVLTKAALRLGSPWQQRIALVEANRISAQA